MYEADAVRFSDHAWLAWRKHAPAKNAGALRRALDLGLGTAVQFEPMKYTLEAPGTMRFKLQCDTPLSSFTFKCKLRRYV
jgi:hypothetical protein